MTALPEPPVPYWKCVIAALPDICIGLQFLFAGQQLYLPGMGAGAFAPLLQSELLVAHAMLLLGFIALSPAEGAQQKLGQRALFWGLFAFYLLMAAGIGREVLAGFVVVMVGTNAGLLLTWRTPTATAQLGARCAVTLLVFFLSAGLVGMPSKVEQWGEARETFLCGAVYFLALAGIELTGFYLRFVPRIVAQAKPAPANDAAAIPAQMQRAFAATGRWITCFLAWSRRQWPGGKEAE